MEFSDLRVKLPVLFSVGALLLLFLLSPFSINKDLAADGALTLPSRSELSSSLRTLPTALLGSDKSCGKPLLRPPLRTGWLPALPAGVEVLPPVAAAAAAALRNWLAATAAEEEVGVVEDDEEGGCINRFNSC